MANRLFCLIITINKFLKKLFHFHNYVLTSREVEISPDCRISHISKISTISIGRCNCGKIKKFTEVEYTTIYRPCANLKKKIL